MFAAFWNDPMRRELLPQTVSDTSCLIGVVGLGKAFAHADNPVGPNALHGTTVTYLPVTLLVKMDIASMHCGLKPVPRLLDHEVIEFCARYPCS